MGMFAFPLRAGDFGQSKWSAACARPLSPKPDPCSATKGGAQVQMILLDHLVGDDGTASDRALSTAERAFAKVRVTRRPKASCANSEVCE